MSSIVNKIKDAVHSDKHSSAPEGTHGPHSSRAANAADPRVDSDRDGSNTMGAGRTAGHGEYGSGSAFGSTTHDTHNTYGTGTTEGTHGPHSSRVANAMDPRVDSDRDGSNTMGTGRTAGHGEFGSGNTFGSTGTHNTFGSGTGTSEGAHGPHNSRITNAMDPRVDSDRDGSRTMGTGAGTGSSMYSSGSTGMTGTHGASTGTHGPHNSRLGNTMDPRVDSDRDGRSAFGTGPGPAPNTAGPHKSDMANKMDPRVDSDLDGSTTAGANRTYQ